MRGKSHYKKRAIKPDWKYNSAVVAKLINYVMRDGKKTVAQKIVYTALENSAKTLKVTAVALLDQALENAKPLLEVKPRRLGGATYQVPQEVRPERSLSLSLKTITFCARRKQGKPMAEFLAAQLIDAYNNTGDAIAKKNELHKLAEQNKAFAHFAKY